jgi:hypothetical protein
MIYKHENGDYVYPEGRSACWFDQHGRSQGNTVHQSATDLLQTILEGGYKPETELITDTDRLTLMVRMSVNPEDNDPEGDALIGAGAELGITHRPKEQAERERQLRLCIDLAITDMRKTK